MPKRITAKKIAAGARDGNKTPVSRAPRCRHITPKGYRCRLLQTSELGFCRHHAAPVLAAEAHDAAALAQELLGTAKNFKTAIAVNDVIGRALRLFVERRLTVHEVKAIVSLAQMLIFTQGRLYSEYSAIAGYDAWYQVLQHSAPEDAIPDRIEIRPFRNMSAEELALEAAASKAADQNEPAA